MRKPHIAIATIGCLALTAIAAAQVPEIVVEAPYRPAHAPIPPGSTQLPEISVTSRVNYSDLDLSSNTGATELQKRIKTSASEACKQLQKLYPNSTEGVGKESCVEGAVNKAMVQANKAITAAEKPKK